ncbi:MAG: VIT1/CCC1 transporter family protein [Acidobacteria bacterium]|nr:VIT1/CCC1 transporter family protein [Acidobacteriota bacterium]
MSESWDHHYRDEQDAAYLYDALAAIEPDADRRQLFSKLATVERKHVDRWVELYEEDSRPLPTHSPSLRTRGLVWIARRFGANAILPLIVAEEGREVESYLRIARRADQKRTQETAMGIAADSAVHAQELSALLGREGEPWHTPGAGGYLRSVVYGFNDGLTANFGLVAGVIGANVPPHIVIITGIAGAIADALSMGSSGYLAAKSQSEVQAHQIDMERHEIRMMPEIEEEELALIYEARGMPADRARELAGQVMKDPSQALAAKVREELNITAADISPLADGLVTGIATAVGAFIPILPFVLLARGSASWTSLTISMLAHFAIGAARSLFTGRSVWASGRDMFVVGFGVAAVGYAIGELIVRFF